MSSSLRYENGMPDNSIITVQNECRYISIKFNRQGTLLSAGCFDGHVAFFDLLNLEIVCKIEAFSEAVTSMDFSRDGHFFAAGSTNYNTSSY